MIRPTLLAAAAALILAAPSTALAADPVPGATYEGTTDTGNPFSLKVSPDGTAVTEIVTSAALTCVGPEGGVEIFAVVSQAPIPISGRTISGKDEEPTPRLDEVTGTFTSPTEVKGKVLAATSKFKIGEGVTSCMREIEFTAHTAAVGNAPAAGGGAGLAPAPAALALTSARGTLKGLSIKGTAGAPGKVTAVARLKRKAARRYGVKVLAKRTVNVTKAGAFTIKLTPSGKVADKLAKADGVKVTIELTGPGGTQKRTVTLG